MRKPLQALQDRLAGAAEERHALLHLGRHGPVLDEQDVGQGMAGAEHGGGAGMALAEPFGDVVPERVDLVDRLRLIALVDLVVGHGHPPIYSAVGAGCLRFYLATLCTHLSP